MAKKRGATETQQQQLSKRVFRPAALLPDTAIATAASIDDPSPPPPPGSCSVHVSVPPALLLPEVGLGDSSDRADDGGCTAEALVRIGVWSCKEAAVKGLDAQIKPMTEELQKRRGGPLEEAEAGVPREQWHEEAIKRAVVKSGEWHFHKVKIDSTDTKAVDL